MFDREREFLWENYSRARDHFIADPDALIMLECYVSCLIHDIIGANYLEIEHDYNEASYLNAFWANYPPDGRESSSAGDCLPWSEVGEQAVGHKLFRLASLDYQISEIGLPAGADHRFVLYSGEISDITGGLTDCAFVHLDIQSAGPRSESGCVSLSPGQASGDGVWPQPAGSMENSPVPLSGAGGSRAFYPAVSPIYALTDGRAAPTVHLLVRPVYRTLSLEPAGNRGYPLKSIQSICIPNGLLLTCRPNYLGACPDLLRPVPEDGMPEPRKARAQVSFEVLSQIDRWRVSEFSS